MRLIDSRVILGLAVILLTVVLIGSYGPLASEAPADTSANPDASNIEDGSLLDATVEASNRFAFELYNRYSLGDGNILYSPYSISTALSMVYEGAGGETADEMADVFHFIEEPSSRREEMARLYGSLNGASWEYELHTANALWMQEDYPILEDYIDTIMSYYGGEANSLDFGASEEARLTINSWVEEETNDRIKDLFPPDSISPEAVLVLTNAIYFKDEWLTEFNEADTSRDTFNVAPMESVEVDMMSLKGMRFNYTKTDELQVLELPYTGGDVSMTLILPNEDNIAEVESNLSYDEFNALTQGMEESLVDVYLPRFKLETKYFMREDLIEMGMPLAFTPCANLTGISEEGGLYIDKVIHQAFIEVDEKGTEAAAATGVVILKSSVDTTDVFRADHPFIFVLQDRVTGAILFMGRVTTPK